MSGWFRGCGWGWLAAAIVMLPTAVTGCEGELSESEARRVIDEQVLVERFAGVEIDLTKTPLWKSGQAAWLTTRDKCWPSDGYTSGEVWRYLLSDEISPQCPNIKSAKIGLSNGQWWAHGVNLAAYNAKVDKIVEVLTKDNIAKVTYTMVYYESDLYKEWRAAGLPNVLPPDPASVQEACLQKWDQGWRLCGR